MSHFTIFHTDLPAEIRFQPYHKRHTAELARFIREQARQHGIGCYDVARESDRIVVTSKVPEAA